MRHSVSAILAGSVLAFAFARAQQPSPASATPTYYVEGVDLLRDAGIPLTIEAEYELEIKAPALHRGRYCGRQIWSRDADGRVYIEDFFSETPCSDEPRKLRRIDLTDPTDHSMTVCVPKEKHCAHFVYTPHLPVPSASCTDPVQPGPVSWQTLGGYVFGEASVIHTRQVCSHGAGRYSALDLWRNPELKFDLNVTPTNVRSPSFQMYKGLKITRTGPDPAMVTMIEGFEKREYQTHLLY